MPHETKKSPEMYRRICNGLIEGHSLRKICAGDDMPAPSTVCLWLSEDRDFAEQYARAREIQMENLAEEIIEIADDGSNDWMKSNKPGDEGYRLNGEHVQRSRLRVDTKKWLMSKLAPKKYGDTLDAANRRQDDGDSPVAVVPGNVTMDDWIKAYSAAKETTH